jgi:hypothetical protein
MGLKPAAHHKLLIQALQETAEGKIDRFAAWLSQINLRLDIVLAVVSGDTPGSRLARSRNVLAASHTTELAARFGRGLLLGGYLNPASLARHGEPPVAVSSCGVTGGRTRASPPRQWRPCCR